MIELVAIAYIRSGRGLRGWCWVWLGISKSAAPPIHWRERGASFVINAIPIVFWDNGGGEIRTHGTLTGPPVFKDANTRFSTSKTRVRPPNAVSFGGLAVVSRVVSLSPFRGRSGAVPPDFLLRAFGTHGRDFIANH